MKKALKTFKSIVKDIATNEITLNIYLLLCLTGLIVAIYNILDLIFIFWGGSQNAKRTKNKRTKIFRAVCSGTAWHLPKSEPKEPATDNWYSYIAI